MKRLSVLANVSRVVKVCDVNCYEISYSGERPTDRDIEKMIKDGDDSVEFIDKIDTEETYEVEVASVELVAEEYVKD